MSVRWRLSDHILYECKIKDTLIIYCMSVRWRLPDHILYECKMKTLWPYKVWHFALWLDDFVYKLSWTFPTHAFILKTFQRIYKYTWQYLYTYLCCLCTLYFMFRVLPYVVSNKKLMWHQHVFVVSLWLSAEELVTLGSWRFFLFSHRNLIILRHTYHTAD